MKQEKTKVEKPSEKVLKERVVPPGAKIRDMPWKQLVIRMRDRVEETSKLLLTKRKAQDIRVQKKLGMMRLALLNQMHSKTAQEVDISFLLETIELINRMEELLEQYEHDVSDWLDFLSAIERKLESDGVLMSDEDLAEQTKRLKSAIDKLKVKLEERGEFKPLG